MKYDNPYRASGTFTGESYVEREADSQLLKEILLNSRYPYILAPRQSGKSSLIANTIKKLRKQDFLVVFVDLTTIDDSNFSSYENFLNAIIEGIDESIFSLEGRKYKKDKSGLISYLREILLVEKRRVVIFLDEVDKLIPFPYKDNFFGLVRSIYNRRARDDEKYFNNLQFILSGTAEPIQLISKQHASPFNVGTPIKMKELSIAEITGLVKYLGEYWEIKEGLEKYIHSYTNGSVYLTQLMLEKTWSFLSRQLPDQADSKVIINQKMIEEIADDIVKEASENIHFLNIYSGITSSPNLLKAFTDLVSGLQADRQALNSLKLLGITDGERPYSNFLYETVFGPSGTLDIFGPSGSLDIPTKSKNPPLTATSIATLMLNTAEELGGRLAEDKYIYLSQKLQALKQLVGNRFQGRAKTVLALADQGNVSDSDIETVANYLGVAMAEDDNFTQRVSTLAQEIQQIISIEQLRPGQNVFGGEGSQVNNPDGPVFTGSGNTINITTGFSKSDGQSTRNLGVPRQVPPLPSHFVERIEHQTAIKQLLVCEDAKLDTLVVSAIYGLGGIGKSVLASKLAHDPEIQARFFDGILWATLGQQPDILPLLSNWIQELGDYDYKPTAVESASKHLLTLLYDKHVLLVVDDVWHPEHLEPFRVGGKGCCVLVTTREARIPDVKRYDLDVMTADQALKLITQKLSYPLTDDEHQQALTFAERVGYLPLALELAASQIEEGVTWSELLDDLQDEVARLETLDIYGRDEIRDDAKRRKYSLLACFNLSLKQLSTEQLRQFAWLGIVPEDVSLTQEMAETLWQVTSRQSRANLRTFKSKALILQGIKQANGQPTYRMHDLMHDLAGRLLTSLPQPIQVGDLPGLGLTKAEAHSELLNRYRAKTKNGQWHTLEDDGYIYAHLTWHMEQAKQPQEIHRLLQVNNDQGRNGWYEACDAIGKPAGFVNDLGRAWQLAIDAYEDNPSASVTLVFRYALIRASINSLASNVPAELIGALVEKGVWQAAQGLAYAQQAQDPWHRAECISAIVPHMPKALLPEVLKTIDQINDAVYRSYVLSKLAENFAEVWPTVLETIKQIQDRYGEHREETQGFSYRAFAISQIAKLLPSQYLSEAIDITRQIQDTSDRIRALTELAKRRVELWPNALEVTRQIQDEYSRSSALSAMAQHLPDLWSDALEVTRQIHDESFRSSALSAMAQHLPEPLWPDALEVTRQIHDEYSRSRALSAMAQHFPDLWPETLEVTRQIHDEYSRSRALSAMAQHLPEPLWPETLEVTRQIHDESFRSRALSAMAQHLPELWPETLEVTRHIHDESFRSRALSAMAQHLPEPLLSEALEVTQKIQDEYSRSRALSAMAQHLPEPLLPEALEVTRQIQDEYSRAHALREIAQHLPDLWPETLEVTRHIHDEYSRAHALRAMAQHLPEPLLPEALEMTRQIQAESYRSIALSAMAQHFPGLWPETLEVTRQIQDESSRSRALSAMAQHLPELWPEALEVTRQIQAESYRSIALSAMAQ
ncbi:AAA-like domain-containing protein, partial [Adonisia turfae]|uniref:AAA-like domain-containing protein n=1 Tax=Adonisia turfae TaxID=2950184 RepID=UPI0020299DCD